jgi:DNA polymerase-1
VEECQDRECENFRQRKQVPFRGPADAKVIICGEYPGHTELLDGISFVGPSGKLLNLLAQQAGLDLDFFFIANSAVCRLDKEKYTLKQQNSILAHCRRFVERAVRIIKPKAIIALGGIAMQQILRLTNIKKKHGLFTWSDEFNCWVMPSYHPAYCLRNQSFVQDLLGDLRKFKRFQDNAYKPLDAFRNYKFESVDDVTLLPKGKVVAIDTETQGLDWLDGVLISYSLCFDDKKAYQIRLHELQELSQDFNIRVVGKEGRKKTERIVGVKRSINYQQKVEHILNLLADNKVKKYMFNGQFDLLWLNTLSEGMEINNYSIDVQAAAHLLDENVHIRASLEQARKYYTDLDTSYSVDFDSKYDKSNMICVPPDALSYYACADAAVTYQAALAVRADLLTKSVNCDKQMIKYFTNFVMPTLTYSLFNLTNNGVMVDKEQLPIVKEALATTLMECYNKALALIPPRVLATNQGKLKLSRTPLIRDVLYSEDGYHLKPVARTTKGTAVSIDAKSRTFLKAGRIPKAAAKFINAYEAWSEVNTLLSRYIKNFEQSIKGDGRIHPSYSIVTTATGRSSTSSPSLQNIPATGNGRIMRSLMVAPPGYILLALDQSQMELRIMAHCSQDENMLRVYQTDGDIHTATAEVLAGKSKDEMSEEEFKAARKVSKSLNFGLLYGMKPYGYQRYAKVSYDLDITDEGSKRHYDTFFQTYPGIKRYHMDTLRFVKENGYAVSLFGRRRRLPGITSNDEKEVERCARQAFNHTIQCSASDITLVALNQLSKLKLLNPVEIKPIMFVHDELVFEVRGDLLEKYLPIIKHEMECPPLYELFGVTLTVPLKVEAKVGPNYADLTPIE